MDGSTFTLDIGLWKAAETVRSRLTKRFSYQFADTDAMEAMLSRKVFIREGDVYEHNVSDIIDEALAPYAKGLFTELENHWGERLRTNQNLLFSGGSSMMLREHIHTQYPWATFGSQMDNARGYHWLAEQIAGGAA